MRRKPNLHARDSIAGWLFTTPMIAILGVFLFVPVLMAFWVSLTNWKGNVDPFGGGPNATFVGAANYASLFTEDSLTRSNFMQSLGNTFFYVLLVVPLQTTLALLLALVVNKKLLKGKGFFRTTFYLPSVTSSIAISTVFLFLFSNSGAVNALLKLIGISGPQWFSDSRGLLHLALGLFGFDNPGWTQGRFLGRSVWEWISGPSVAMTVIIMLAVWTTTGTFMLMFLAALQDLPVEIDEATAIDGASRWKKLTLVTIPMLRPAIFLVTTLGMIGTWQVFDQIYVMGKGSPAGTTMTPAFLSYRQSFRSLDYGSGAAMAFLVFAIIVVLTWWQRHIMREDKPIRRKKGSLLTGSARQSPTESRGRS